ncbi:glycosyltransferase family 1 protein [bacterium]|nr:MAG: glycosyltransferase family 1 protein [bacterium]
MTRPLVVLDALLVNRHPTGVGRAILELTRAMAAGDHGLEFAVMVTEPEMFQDLEEVPHWRVVPCPGARGGTFRKAWFTQTRLPVLCRDLGAELLHSMHFVAPRWPRCRSVVTVCDLAWQLFPETVEQPRRAYYRLFVPSSIERAQAVLGISEATARDVARLYPAAAERVIATPFATPGWIMDHLAAEPDPPPPRQRRFLFVGTLEPRKNLERLLDAFALALETASDGDFPSLLLVGGRGWKDSNLRRRMDTLTTAGVLEVRDYCDQAELGRLYRTSLALLFPSLNEGFGFPILEAMASGLPVLTSDRGATAEVAADAAVLVDPEDTAALASGLLRLAADAPLREKLTLAGPQRARQWSWSRTARETVAVYRRLLTPGPRII